MAGAYPLKQNDFEKLDKWEHQATTASEQRAQQLRHKTEADFSGVAGDMVVDLHAKGPDPNFFSKLKEWREDPAHPERRTQISESRLEAFYKNYSEAAKAPDDQTKLPNPEVVDSFRQRVASGEDTFGLIDQLMAAEAKGDISKKQFDEFNARVKERMTLQGKDIGGIRKDFFDKMKPSIDTQFGQTKYPQGTPLGQQNIFKFEAEARAKEAELMKKGQDPKSLYDPASPNYIGKDENLARWRTTKQDNEHYELQLQQQQKANNGVSETVIEHIKSMESFTPVSKWDFKQHSYGYGTRAPGPGIPITKAEAEKELSFEVGKAAREVDAFQPGLPPGVRDAMISLTFNAGPGQWTTGGLGAALKAGDYQRAKEIFLQYNKAGGSTQNVLSGTGAGVLGGLVKRREKEAAWFDKAIAEQQASMPVARTPEEARAKLQPGQLFRTPEGRILRVPRTKQD
jgi:lysozyme